ncbi:hypothetical protein FQN51_007115 [Onygenales sp. PD_10]|nr:hypothetical protein FQN51_007115 [Onygenales sp. PD_10]
MGAEGDPAVVVADQGEVTVECLSKDEEEEVNIESLKVGTLGVAAKVTEGDPSHASGQVKKLILHIPKELDDSLHPYQLHHEVACLQFLAHSLPDIPALRVLLWDDRAPQPLIAQEYIDGQHLSIARLREMRFNFIGGLNLDTHMGPTIKGGKVFCGKVKFYSHDCYNIGLYIDSKDYILSCYDCEIYYHSHADEKDIMMKAFKKVTITKFIEFLKLEKEKILRDVELFQALDAEPWVLLLGLIQPIKIFKSDWDGATEVKEDK